jgi:hypothetical protein
MSKRSKSKEGVGSNPLGVNVSGNGSITQRNNVEEMKFSQTMNIQDQKSSQHQRSNQGSGLGGASKSIFNASYKELKPSKSVDLSGFNGQSQAQNGPYDESLFNQLTMSLNLGGEGSSTLTQNLLREKERIVQIACGSIHTLARSNNQRLFSCGNGSTFALGHKNRDSCSTFKQIEFFNGNED